MSVPPPSSRVRLETKVMAAVLAVLVALPAITVWIVDRYLSKQVQRDADLALSTARSAVVQGLKTRNEELAMRFRTSFFENDRRFIKVLELNDEATMRAFLEDYVLTEFRDTEMAIFVNQEGVLFAKAHTSGSQAVSVDGLAAMADSLIRSALEGEIGSENVVVSGNAYDVVALPVVQLGRLLGVLVFGIRIGDATLHQVKPPETEILMLTGKSEVAAATLKDPSEIATVLLLSLIHI